MNRKLIAQIETALGTSVTDQSSLPVGFGIIGLRVKLADGREAAVKASREAHDHNLGLQAFMLRELRANSQFPVPEVYYSGDGLLIMEWLKSGGSINPKVQHHAAELLAEMHSLPFDSFGYSQDTLIGPLHQPNPQTKSWIEFFRDSRLLYMASEAVKENRLPISIHKRLQELASQINQYLIEPKHPSLLHGDLWGGNIIARNNHISGFIDPAIYCGHPEIELAFTTMFSTFGEPFFDAYQSLAPLEPGFFEERLKIYNLYPTLVHARLFGDSYLTSIDSTLQEFGF
jgi:fructosamine-3-kinase